MLCIWTWLYALIWALCPILGWGRYGPEPFGLSCSLAWGQMKHEGFSFVITLFSFNLVAPSAVIFCCYFGIAFKLYFAYRRSNQSNRLPNIIRLHRRLLIVSASLHQDGDNSSGLDSPCPPPLQIAVLISAGFIGCWAPYGLVSLWSVLRDSGAIPPEVSLLPCMFAKSSTVYNPMIYYIFSQSFKREVKEMRGLCLCARSYRVSNDTNDNGVYMVKVKSSKPHVAAPSTIRDTTESNVLTLA